MPVPACADPHLPPPPARCLLLFTKPARAGRVKTRLTGEGPGSLTPRQAAQLHAAFLGDLVQRLAAASVPRSAVASGSPGSAGTSGPTAPGAEMRLRLAWALDGDPEALAPLPDLAAEVARAGVDALPLSLPPGCAVDAVAQRGADLGERLYRALAAAAGEHPGGVAAVGSDHPALPLARVRAAFAALADHDVALGPADDGGYYLIALRPGAVHRDLFAGVAWSTDTVRRETEERCRRRGLSVALLPQEPDVDEPADLERLARALAAGADPDADSGTASCNDPGSDPGTDPVPGPAADCPRTRRLLAAWGRLPTPRLQEVAR